MVNIPRKNIFAFLGRQDIYYLVTRYALSGLMLSFGVMKITGMQFNNIAGPTSSYQQPLEYISGIQLTWAFLGYSRLLQFLLGIFEFIPAALLLFRRTALLGAVLLFPMTFSVFLINFLLHLWSDTRMLSLVLLLLNLFVFVFERQRVSQILSVIFPPGQTYRHLLPEICVALIFVSYPVAKKLRADYGRSYQNVLTGDWFHRHPVEFTLIEEKKGDSTLPHHLLKCFFGSWDEYSEINDSANNRDDYKLYFVNENYHWLRIARARKRTTGKVVGTYCLTGIFRFDIVHDSLLILEQKTTDSVTHQWIFKKRIMNPEAGF